MKAVTGTGMRRPRLKLHAAATIICVCIVVTSLSFRQGCVHHNSSQQPAVHIGPPKCTDANSTHAALSPLDVVVPDISTRTEDVLPDVAKQVLEQERGGKGKKVISMSLFGDNPRYWRGAMLNAVVANRDWSDWTLRIYYGQGVPEEAICMLQTLGAEMVKVNVTVQNSRVSMFWRFEALSDPSVTRMISRDADSLLIWRDLKAVEEWIKSGKFFHTMHDHPMHTVPVLGGMWGAVNGFLNPRVIQAWRDTYQAKGGNDQDWLQRVVWPLVKSNTLDHSAYLCHVYGAQEWRPFPTKRFQIYDMVGNAYRPEENYWGNFVPMPCPAQCRGQPDWEYC